MAHYAFIDDNNIVISVITGVDEDSPLPDGYTSWEQFYGELKGYTCKRTSYNTIKKEHVKGGTPFRGNYAGIGDTYDVENDRFIGEKEYPSFVWNESEYEWQPPVARPETDPDKYEWNEEAYQADNTQGWVLTPENR